MPQEQDVSLNREVESFATVGDQVALGDLDIRRRFARDIMVLFAVSNIFVLLALAVLFKVDCAQLAAQQIRASERIVNSHVVMTLLAATTVQLGTVILTIARAIFPGHPNDQAPTKLPPPRKPRAESSA